jgi:hypothetical protein
MSTTESGALREKETSGSLDSQLEALLDLHEKVHQFRAHTILTHVHFVNSWKPLAKDISP